MPIKLDDDTLITVDGRDDGEDCVEIMIDESDGGALWLTLSFADAIKFRDDLNEAIRQLTEDQHA